MRQLALALIATASLCASAEPRELNKRVICDTKANVFQHLIKEFKEEPQWHGRSPNQNTELMLTVNPVTGSWTLIEYSSDFACVLAVGENSSSKLGNRI